MENIGKGNPETVQVPLEQRCPPLSGCFEELKFYEGNAVSSLTFSRSMTHALLFDRSCTPIVSSSAKHNHRLDFFPNR
jgi:hypothetical protein